MPSNNNPVNEVIISKDSLQEALKSEGKPAENDRFTRQICQSSLQSLEPIGINGDAPHQNCDFDYFF